MKKTSMAKLAALTNSDKCRRKSFIRHSIVIRQIRENIDLYQKVAKKPDLDHFSQIPESERPIRINERSETGKAYGLVFDAGKQMEKGRVINALNLIEKALKLDRYNDDALLLKASIFEDVSNFDGASKIADDLLKLPFINNHQQAEAYRMKANAETCRAFDERNRNRLETALKHADTGLEYEYDNYDLAMHKAILLYQLGRPEYAQWVDNARQLDTTRTRKFMQKNWMTERPLLE